MKITAKHGRQNKIHISVDGEYLLTVDEIFWADSGYVSGDEIDGEELTAFQEAAGSRIAFNSALNSLDLRDHSVREMRQKLLRKYPPEHVESAIDRLLELGLLNDERFAENYAHTLFEYKKYGRNRIKSELFGKGISSDIINAVLDEIFESDETDNVERIVDIIRKKYYNKMIDENSRRKVFGALIRLGYGYSDIRSAMSEFSDDEYYEE